MNELVLVIGANDDSVDAVLEETEDGQQVPCPEAVGMVFEETDHQQNAGRKVHDE